MGCKTWQLEVVVEGLREVIQAMHETEHEPTATEYFAAALTALSSGDMSHLDEVWILHILIDVWLFLTSLHS